MSYCIDSNKTQAYRLLFNEPIAYINRNAQFFGRDFFVDRRVYIPNPETEGLVQIFLNSTSPDFNATIIDLGTGCGAIAITIKKERPHMTVYATDIDPSVLEVVQINAQKHQVDINLHESLYVDDLDIKSPDFIIADLPFGNDTEYLTPSNNPSELKHLPPISTFHPRGILASYTELLESIKAKNWKPKIFIETGTIPENVVRAELKTKALEYQIINYHSIAIITL